MAQIIFSEEPPKISTIYYFKKVFYFLKRMRYVVIVLGLGVLIPMIISRSISELTELIKFLPLTILIVIASLTMFIYNTVY